jgi:hypothetical protein
MRAARDFDMPLSLRASYCFSFFTFADLLGTAHPFSSRMRVDQFVPRSQRCHASRVTPP